MHSNTILDIVRVTPRNRKPQWTHKETQHLIREFDKRKLLLRPTPGEVVSSASKHRSWVEIAQAVNLTNPHVHRTVSEVQKKWQNLCLRTKKDKDGLPFHSLYRATGDPIQNSLLAEQHRIPSPPTSIQPRLHTIQQPFPSPENASGNDVSHVVPIKIEKVDHPDEFGRTTFTDNSSESRPESTRSQLSYGDVELVVPTSQSEYDMYATSSGLIHTTHEPEAIGELPSIISTSGTPRGAKRKLCSADDIGGYSMVDTELLEVRKNLIMAEMQKYQLECDKLRTEKEKLRLENEKIILEKEKLLIELQNLRTARQQSQISQQKSPGQLEKERMVLENEKLALEIENMRNMHRSAMEKAQLEKQRYSLENDKLSLEIQNMRTANRNNNVTYQAIL